MILFLLLSLLAKNALGANILFISPTESVSHHIWNEVLVQGLLANGHNITFMGHKDTKIKSENYTVYKITGFETLYDGLRFFDHDCNPFIFLIDFWNFIIRSSELHLKSDVLKIILDYPRDKFDLIIFDIVCGQELYPLIEYFGNPPVVGISPFSLPPYILDAMGSHFNYYFPIYHLTYTENMTIFQRAENMLLYIFDYVLKWRSMPIIYENAQERYGKNITPFDQIERRIGILLANYDPVFNLAQSLPPNIIPVGGMHVRRTEKLPNDLKEILDNANEGIIYFSFGTNVQPSWLPFETKQIFLKVFSKLNQTVLWKYTADDLPDVPKNVVIRKWYSQTDILAHKNVKLFITHSGGQSSHEVMYYGVPVLSIPFFADQKLIAGKIVTQKLGKKLHLGDLTEDILHETILEIMNNPIYKQNMQKISRIFRDQKETPLERAVFWVEYALRNKDLNHLSTNARDMTLLQRENLDLYGIIILFIAVIPISLFGMIKYVLKRFVFKKTHKMKQN